MKILKKLFIFILSSISQFFLLLFSYVHLIKLVLWELLYYLFTILHEVVGQWCGVKRMGIYGPIEWSQGFWHFTVFQEVFVSDFSFWGPILAKFRRLDPHICIFAILWNNCIFNNLFHRTLELDSLEAFWF